MQQYIVVISMAFIAANIQSSYNTKNNNYDQKTHSSSNQNARAAF
jgi:hypothetical protein